VLRPESPPTEIGGSRKIERVPSEIEAGLYYVEDPMMSLGV